MELEGSLPSSQELSTCTYPEPDQSSPQHSILSLKGPSYIPLLRSFIQKIRPGPKLIAPFRNTLALPGVNMLLLYISGAMLHVADRWN
jgi:hypothetical protein